MATPHIGNAPAPTEAPVVHYLQQTWETAALLRASDIHFEPFETFYRVRLRVDGVLHSIGFAPAVCLGDDFMAATWNDVAVAMQISAYSLKTLADAFAPLMTAGGSFVGLDFDNTVAWPAYNWMGVAKSALESTSRYLAKELGGKKIRCNLVAAGPIKTMAAKSIPGFKTFEDVWDERSPLGWDVNDSTAVAQACVALLSDWFPATTAEVVHVDGGYHAMGV